MLLNAIEPLYTLQAGNPNYVPLQPNTPLQANEGYWALFGSRPQIAPPSSIAIQQTTYITLPAGQWIMVGDPFSLSVLLSGGDRVLVYNAATGQYTPATKLEPGQGAFVFSFDGGTLVLNPIVSVGSASASRPAGAVPGH